MWAEINLDHIKANVRALLSICGRRQLMAVVKANAYGHGAVKVAKACLEAGASWLGVAIPEEGVELRQAGIEAPILVFGALYPGQEQLFIKHALVATVASPEGVQAACRAAQEGHRLRVHLKIDSGMARLGFSPSEAVSMARRLQEGGVVLEGLYTHLATADETNTAFALDQLRRFSQARQALIAAGMAPLWSHALNTAGLLQSFEDGGNLARSGIGIYGYSPSRALAHVIPLKPAMSWRGRVVAVRRLPAGSPVSYGATYLTPSETTIVTLPMGYADGLIRRLSSRSHVLLGGRRYPIAGRICMDQCLVDVGDYPVHVGDEVVVLGRQGGEEITADELAEVADTISYEILSGLSPRVSRLYVEANSTQGDEHHAG
jgi:alanine racemase